MNRWFYARGAGRGMKGAALAAALWLCWAIGFIQGGTPVPKPGPSAFLSPPSCCQPAQRT